MAVPWQVGFCAGERVWNHLESQLQAGARAGVGDRLETSLNRGGVVVVGGNGLSVRQSEMEDCGTTPKVARGCNGLHGLVDRFSSSRAVRRGVRIRAAPDTMAEPVTDRQVHAPRLDAEFVEPGTQLGDA